MLPVSTLFLSLLYLLYLSLLLPSQARMPSQRFGDAVSCPYVPNLTAVPFPSPSPPEVMQAFASISNLTASMIDPVSVPGGVVDIWYAGSRIYSKGFGVANKATQAPFETTTLTRIASITKAFTATLLAQLVDMRRLSFDTALVDFISNFSVLNPFDGGNMTFRHLVSHTSGLPDFSPVPDRLGNSTAQILSALQNTMLRQPLGAFPQYSNLAFGLLGNVLAEYVARDISQGKWTVLLEKLLLQALSLKDSGAVYSPAVLEILAPGYWFDGSNVTFFDWQWQDPAGAMYSTSEDLSKFLQAWSIMVSGSGGMEGNLGISGPTARQCVQSTTVLPDFAWGVGMPWEIYYAPMNGLPLYSKSGNLPGYTANIAFIPAIHTSIVFLYNGMPNATKDGDPFVPAWNLLLNAIQAWLIANQPPPAAAPRPTDYVGTYTLPASSLYPSLQCRITWAAGALQASAPLPSFPAALSYTGGDTFRIHGNYSQSSCEIDFFSGTTGYQMVFSRNASGAVESFSLPAMMPPGSWLRSA